MASIERLNLGLDAQRCHHATHSFQHARRVRHHIVGLGKVHRATIQRANFRQTFCDMRDPLCGPNHVGSHSIQWQRSLGRSKDHIPAHTRGQVQHQINISVTDTVRNLPIILQISGRCTRFRISHVAMHNSRTRLTRGDRTVGNLFRGTRYMGTAILRPT